jgi:hypothetical protein
MKKDNIIQQKSFAFAVRIVNLYKYLATAKKEFVLSKQLLKIHKQAESLLADTVEICKILGSIQKTIKSRNS